MDRIDIASEIVNELNFRSILMLGLRVLFPKLATSAVVGLFEKE